MPPIKKSGLASESLVESETKSFQVDMSVNDASLYILQLTLFVVLCTLLLVGIVISVTTYFGLGGGIVSVFVLVCHMMVYMASRYRKIMAKRGTHGDGIKRFIEGEKKSHEIGLSRDPAISYLYVLGSGGHTTEMTALIKLSFKANPNQHRRYILTSGDQHSINKNKEIERMIRLNCPDGTGGTHDTHVVTRARSVHQSWFTSIFTSAKSALDILAALAMIPPKRTSQPNATSFLYPHVIVTNGPGTGFIVALVAFMLKLVGLAPLNRLTVIFVETWARTHNLGLTGKLFQWTQIADVFVVQQKSLAKVTGKPDIGSVNMRLAQLKNGQRTSRVAAEV